MYAYQLGSDPEKVKLMAVRQTLCPKCEGRHIEVLKILNPETHDMNADADLKCVTCEHLWVGRITSPRHEKLRARGLRR